MGIFAPHIMGRAIVFALLLTHVGTSAIAHPTAGPASAPLEEGVDASIKPGEDFFSFANGDWLKATQIPANKPRWGARDEIDESTKRQLAHLIDANHASPAGSYQRKAADFYAAYAAEATIEARGTASIKPQLNSIDHIDDQAGLARQLGLDLRADVDPLNIGIYDSASPLGLSVERGIHGETHHFAYLLQGGLGLPSRDAYFDTAPKAQAQRARYQEYIGRLLELAGFDRAAQRAQGVLALETEIAKTHATIDESSSEKNADNHWTLADFRNRAPGMDWSAFFSAAGLAKQGDIVAWQPGAIKGIAALVTTQPLASWKDYLRFHAIHRYADVLPRKFAEQAAALHGIDAAEGGAQVPDVQRALDATNRALPEIVGRIYVEKYFPHESKSKAQAILAHVIDALGKRLESVRWMSPETRKLALSRLRTLYFGIGYPDKWTDYSRLTIDANDVIGNLQRVSDWNYRNALARLAQPTDKTEWMVPPQAVGAIYQPLQNAYNFSAALMQAPKYDPTAPDAASYGAIGAIFGHELSHFIDPLGANYDDSGGAHHWWTNDDKVQFDQACAALVAQFSAYKPFPDLPVDGKLTLSENIADLGGLAAAFDAYRSTLGSKGADKAYVRQQDRAFFIAFARSWRAKMRPEAMRKQLATNTHAPESYRISTVRNLREWYEAFDVLPGQRLYLEPEARVRIW